MASFRYVTAVFKVGMWQNLKHFLMICEDALSLKDENMQKYEQAVFQWIINRYMFANKQDQQDWVHNAVSYAERISQEKLR